MSVPPDQMPPGGGAPPPGMPGGAAPPPGGGPAAAPMMTPQMPAGQQEASRVEVMMASKLLQRAVSAFEPGSKEVKALLNAIKSIGAAFGKTEEGTEQLMPAELRKMIAEFSGAGMPGPNPGAAAPPGGAPPPPGAGAG